MNSGQLPVLRADFWCVTEWHFAERMLWHFAESTRHLGYALGSAAEFRGEPGGPARVRWPYRDETAAWTASEMRAGRTILEPSDVFPGPVKSSSPTPSCHSQRRTLAEGISWCKENFRTSSFPRNGGGVDSCFATGGNS